jgi:hypothetical protein
MLVLGACAPKPTEPEATQAPVVAKSGSAQLFESARQALLDGDAERALELLQEHETKYPKDWGGERDSTRLVAMCASGKEAEATEIVTRRARTERRVIEDAKKSGGGITPFSSAPLHYDDMPALTNTTDCTNRIDAAFDRIVEAPARCRDHDDQARFEACLGEVAPGRVWQAAAGAPAPQGYVCTFFGGPQRSCDAIRTLRSWIERDAKCPRSFSLYVAQHPGWGPDGKMLDLGEGRPPNDPRIHSFDSDGTHFAFSRLSDYVLEARACMEATSTNADLMQWAKLLQPEVFGDVSTN